MRRQRSSLRTQSRLECLEDRVVLAAPLFVPNEVLVKFKDGVSEAEIANVRALAQTTQAKDIQTDAMRAAGYGNLELLRGPDDVLATVALLKNNPLVAYAEPNWVFSHQAVSNDPDYSNGNLWGMYSDDVPSAVGPAGTTNQYGSQAEEAWAVGFTGSQTVYVGIIDEGIQFTHPDLIANVWTNPFDSPLDGIDNDGNGYVDDTHGWDFFTDDETIYDGTSDDHGTHVAGTIGAKGGNSAGVAGVSWNVQYISGKFLGEGGGSLTDAILAIDYMTDLKVRHGLNIVATNNSWGGGGFSQGLLDAITRGANQGILFIAAAGNGGSDGVGDNNDSVDNYPSNYNTTAGAGYDAVIAVAAITNAGARSSFSNYGPVTVDLGAPGSGILSTLPNNSYGSYNGTSMATPHVAGAAALYAAAFPNATAPQIKSAILNSATPTPALNGKTVTGARLNVSALLGPGPKFYINDVTLAEGDVGSTNFTFTVTLSAVSSDPVSVQYATVDGSAVAGSDYAAASNTLNFAPGETTKTFTVVVNGDTTSEPHETFLVNLSNPSGATLTDSQVVGTILNDDALLSINSVTLAEGDSGITAFTFTVSLQNASTNPVTVDYATADSTATVGSDYSANSGELSFAAGQISQTITVSVAGDSLIELDEIFFVNLTSPTNATFAVSQGVGNILDDDTPALSIIGAPLTEGLGGTVEFIVTLSKPSILPVKVNFATVKGTAVPGDYLSKAGTLLFSPRETQKILSIKVKNDTRYEADETFFMTLTAPSNAKLANGQSQAQCTILNDDLPPTLTISDKIVTEGTSSTPGNMVFTVRLSAASDLPVTVDYRTLVGVGTATASDDYTAVLPTTLEIPAGKTNKTITVQIVGDARDESNEETFIVELSNQANATLADAQGLGTIKDNDLPPKVRIDNVTQTEGTGDLIFTLTLSAASNLLVTGFYDTADETAKSGIDYNGITGGIFTFNPGELTFTVTVSIINNPAAEPTKNFKVNLKNTLGTVFAKGIGTILDNV